MNEKVQRHFPSVEKFILGRQNSNFQMNNFKFLMHYFEKYAVSYIYSNLVSQKQKVEVIFHFIITILISTKLYQLHNKRTSILFSFHLERENFQTAKCSVCLERRLCLFKPVSRVARALLLQKTICSLIKIKIEDQFKFFYIPPS